MRTFQISDGKSHRFWNIDVTGKGHAVTYGKVGSAGRTHRKTFAAPADALADMERLVEERLKKGYVETTRPPLAPEEAAFRQALAENVDDLAGWCAYADYLVEQGDPRGEFMQTQIALEDESLSKPARTKLRTREQNLLKKHQATWLGGIAPFLLDQPKPKYRWRDTTIHFAFRRGWLAELEVPEYGVEFGRVLNRCPEACLLRKLHIHSNAIEYPANASDIPDYIDTTYVPGPDLPKGVQYYDAAYHVLAKYPYFASIRSFHLGNPLKNDYDDSTECHTWGGLAFEYARQMPHVEELRLLCHRYDPAKLFALPLPRLRVLQVFHVNKHPLEPLVANRSLGELTHLLFQAHAPDHSQPYLRLRELRLICRATNMPKLTHLALRYSDFGDEGVTELIASGMLKRLKVLDLRGGCITDDGAKELAACADAKRLERLDLNTNALSVRGVKALAAAGINASTKSQHHEVPPFGSELPLYLYDGDME